MKTALSKEKCHRRAVLASKLLLESKRHPEADLEKERNDPTTRVGKLYAEFKALREKS
jgi:hypothetical protein